MGSVKTGAITFPFTTISFSAKMQTSIFFLFTLSDFL
jgi:hypothetical protein